ncbi:MAG: hypothetical protein KIT27_12425, partial [Legionellales bacterium]|nr:hypothetical protein [Legionellales bacterium]
YPIEKINLSELKKYAKKHVIDIEQHDEHVSVDITLNNEEGFGWTEGEGLLADLLPLYNELNHHNYHLLRLVLAMHSTLTGENDAAVNQLLTEDNLLSEAEQVLLECFEIKTRTHA